MKFSSATRQVFADGFPATDAVAARRLRARGDVFRRSGSVLLTNGTNAFTVDLTPYKKVSVKAGEGGEHSLVGYERLGQDESPTLLASFGSAEAATNGYKALLRAHSGIKLSGAGSPVKWVGGLAGLFLCVFVLLASLTPVEQPAVAAGAPPDFAAQMAQMQSQAHANPTAPTQVAGFNPAEPSLESLAAGNYEFRPQLKAPDVAAPSLNCAKR